MADLDFKHHVSEIPRGEKLPEPVQRKVAMETSRIPDFQSPVSNYGSATNWMSGLGSKVAASASNAIATKIGGELGKNPQGELGPAITNFDKQLSDSYTTQAQATLGIEAQKLITKSNLELAEQPRINQDMISKAQKNTMVGLDRIFSLAPNSIRPQMEQSYGSLMIHQNEQLVSRMMDEQKKDRLDNLELSSNMSAENAFSLSMGGDDKAAMSYMLSTIRAVTSSVEMHDITPMQAKNIEDKLRLSYLSGKYTRLAVEADRRKQLPEFLSSLADDAPGELSEQDKSSVYSNVVQYMNMQANLRMQNQQLKLAKFEEQLILDPLKASTQFNAMAADLTPYQAEKAKIQLIQSVKKQQHDDTDSQFLSHNWNNTRAHSNSSSDLINKTFNDKVKYVVEQGQINNDPVSTEDAEVLVASSAGGEVSVFTKTLKNGLSSSNPNIIESTIQQIHKLTENGNGQALKGLTEQDWSMVTAAQHLRDAVDPVKAAQDAHNRIYNQDPEIEKLNNKKFSTILSTQNRSGISEDNFALKTFGMSKGDFLNQSIATAYGVDILNKLQSAFSISGDFNEAKQTVQREVEKNYGDTFVNGGKHKTLHPIESVVGFKVRDGVPYIQNNLIQQLDDKFTPLKSLYDRKIKNEYWETIPVEIPQSSKGFQFEKPELSTYYLESKNQESALKLPRNAENSPFKFAQEGIKKESNYLKYERTFRDFQGVSENPSQTHGMFFKTFDPIRIKRHMRDDKGVEKTDVFNVVLIGNNFGNYDIAIESKEGIRNLFQEAPFLGVMTLSPQVDKIWEHYNRDHK